MTIVSMKEYYDNVARFANTHEVSRVETSSMVDGQWHKHYICSDGHSGVEHNRPVYEQVEVEVKGVKVKVEVKLLETEWYDTEIGKSIYMYQQF